jgi:hypothetical protein
MTQPIAIIIAGALIAVTIMLTVYWTFNSTQFLLNRWTGTVTYCNVRSGGWDVECPPPPPKPIINALESL